LAEIYTVGLHSSYTAENWHVMCNENNVMQKFYHPLRMTVLLLVNAECCTATKLGGNYVAFAGSEEEIGFQSMLAGVEVVIAAVHRE
jgi:hypothetical protein